MTVCCREPFPWKRNFILDSINPLIFFYQYNFFLFKNQSQDRYYTNGCIATYNKNNHITVLCKPPNNCIHTKSSTRYRIELLIIINFTHKDNRFFIIILCKLTHQRQQTILNTKFYLPHHTAYNSTNMSEIKSTEANAFLVGSKKKLSKLNILERDRSCNLQPLHLK